MSNTRLLQAAMPAERMRGAKFCEDFRDHLSMIKGGWTLFNAPTFAKNGGLVLNGTTQYASIPLGNELASTTITVHLEWIPTAVMSVRSYVLDTSATNRFALIPDGAGNIIVDLSGTVIHTATYATWNALLLTGKRNVLTITKLVGAAAILWLNGSVVANATGIVAPSGAATTPLLVGKNYAAANYYAATFSRILIGHYLCTLDEHQAYYNRTMWNWEDRCLVNLQMRTGDYDPTAVRTLDSSGHDLHATLGDGVTPTTYPAQSKGCMVFDGGDSLRYVSMAQPTGAFTAAFCYNLTGAAASFYLGNHTVVGFADLAWLLTRTATGVFQFYVGDVGAYIYTAPGYLDKNTHTLVGTWNGTIAQLYLDGALLVVATTGVPVQPAGAALPVRLGQAINGAAGMIGSIYDFKYRDGEAWNQVMCLDYHQKMMSRLGAEQ